VLKGYNPPKLGIKPRKKMTCELGRGKSNKEEKSWLLIEYWLREIPTQHP
jgi:hypothetical protein